MGERWQKIEELFREARMRDVTLRAAYLHEACTGDEALRHEVERLLESEDESLLQLSYADAGTSSRKGPVEAASSDTFRNTDRFRVLREIGRGGMGVVYEAYDNEKKVRVALKTLVHLTPTALYSFKKEFRLLARVSHPNLVTLYELFSQEGNWFFTMEFIDGVNCLEYVCPGYQRRRNDPALGPASESDAQLRGQTAARPSSPCDMDRLRAMLIQLVEAIRALHALGFLHRDLKPLNVLVTPERRVVVVDFGLLEQFAGAIFEMPTHATIAGTIPYMSPEQAAGKPLTETSDWYSVGVMLYEALTGSLPFVGSSTKVLLAKQIYDPRLPSETVSNIPEDLDRICGELLLRDPGYRLSGKDVITLLERRQLPRDSSGELSVIPAQTIFIGRQEQLSTLWHAFSELKRGITCIAYIHGKPGMGKSSLVRHFLEELGRRSDVVIVAGRCYEQESVPYKALDSVVDALTNYMGQLPRHEVAELIPRDVAALAQAFPVLQQLDVVAEAPRRSLDQLDQHELRRRVFLALREFLARLGDRKRLIIYIDDLQWGDTDSALFLREILRPPDAPQLLLIGSRRDEYSGKGLLFSDLLTESPAEALHKFYDVSVGPLTLEEIREMMSLLRSSEGQVPVRLQMEALAEETDGNPYLIHELIRGFESAGPSAGGSGRITLESVIWARISSLSEPARRLLEVVAVSGRPIRQWEAYHAAGQPFHDPKVFAMLRSTRLVNSTGLGDQDLVEAFHDRVRETVLAQLDRLTLKKNHREIAMALESSDFAADAENVGLHWEAAGELDKAGHYFEVAAKQAAAALAFKRAADLFQRRLELFQGAGEERRQLQVKLADALANAGRGAEAARNYQEAAEGAGEPEVFELESQAAHWFAASGHVDEGREAFRKMLQRVRLQLPGSPQRTLLSLLIADLQLRLRGLRFQVRPQNAIPREKLDRIDAAWYAAQGLSIIDFLNGANFTTRCLLLALRAGEVHRIARSLCWMLPHTSAQGPARWRQLPKLMAVCERLVSQLDTPYLRGVFLGCKGCAAFFQGRWREGLETVRQGMEIHMEHCTGVSREISLCQLTSLYLLFCLGRYEELTRTAPVFLSEAQERGDLFLATSVGTWFQPFAHLVADRPEEALRAQENSLDQWTRRYYHVQHASAAYIRTWIYLYQGDPQRAWQHINEEWPKIEKHHYSKMETLAQFLHYSRAEAALAMAMTTADKEPFLRSAERDAQELEKHPALWPQPMARMVRSGMMAMRGDRSGAAAELETAEEEFAACDMTMMAAATRWRLGKLVDGERGKALIQTAWAEMHTEGVRNPVRMIGMFLNGFPSASLAPSMPTTASK